MLFIDVPVCNNSSKTYDPRKIVLKKIRDYRLSTCVFCVSSRQFEESFTRKLQAILSLAILTTGRCRGADG
jgi:hypothetical protein